MSHISFGQKISLYLLFTRRQLKFHLHENHFSMWTRVFKGVTRCKCYVQHWQNHSFSEACTAIRSSDGYSLLGCGTVWFGR